MSNTCCGGKQLIFACSGAADVGAIADQAARSLTKDGMGSMFCLAGVGGRVAGIMKTTAAASRILAIDGCPLSCVKHCLEEAGFTRFEHLQLASIGFEKGKSPLNEDAVVQAAIRGKEILSREYN
jgi:uncharacterized metal-binding protein